MRDEYPNCIISIDNSESSWQILKSLRYSTHCEYYFSGKNDKLKSYYFPHFHLDDSPSRIELGLQTKTFYIDCSNDNFIFGQKETDNISVSKATAELKCLIDSQIPKLEEGIMSLLKGGDHFSIGEFVFLIDYEGKCNPLSAFLEMSRREYYTSLKLQNVLKYFCDEISNGKFSDSVFTIKVNNKDNNFEFEIYLSEYRKSWELFRSLGINIPLIAIQNLFLRKITTHLFVRPEVINLIVGHRIFYSLNPVKYYFDLDETLICRGSPIRNLVNYLFSLSEHGKHIILLTRHIYDIKTTLNSLGIDPNIFVEIIKVKKNKKKSEYIEPMSNSVFIDNEFPERFDVWKNCKINVIDLDQIDFVIFQ